MCARREARFTARRRARVVGGAVGASFDYVECCTVWPSAPLPEHRDAGRGRPPEWLRHISDAGVHGRHGIKSIIEPSGFRRRCRSRAGTHEGGQSPLPGPFWCLTNHTKSRARPHCRASGSGDPANQANPSPTAGGRIRRSATSHAEAGLRGSVTNKPRPKRSSSRSTQGKHLGWHANCTLGGCADQAFPTMNHISSQGGPNALRKSHARGVRP